MSEGLGFLVVLYWPDLESLHDEPEFAEIVAEIEADMAAQGDCSPGKAGGIKVSRSKRLDGTAARPLAPPYGGPTIS